MDHYKLFINGEFVDAASGQTFESIDPGTGAPVATVAKAGAQEAEAAIQAARKAFDSGVWSELTPAARLEKLNAFADQVTQQALRLAITEAMDSGHIIRLAKYWGMLGSQIIRNYGHYAAYHFPWEEEIPYAGNVFAPGRDYTRREPIGVCVGIIPWNFPLSMAFWKIAPAIAMGNTVVLKPATSTPLGALILAEAVKAAGIPDGVVNIIAGPGGELGETLCTHPSVDKIAFTGSTSVGRNIMEMASGTIKKVTLELGGKSANIVLDDADLDMAVEGAIFGTFFHQGQVCESGTRVLVSSKIYDKFLEKMKNRAENLRIGYQLDPSSHQGPLVNAQQLATVEDYVKIGKKEGARLMTGGKRARPEGLEGGFYYEPTVFADVENSMRIAREEIFGPVVCVIKYDTDEQAVEIANDSDYGLAGGIFSGSNARAERIARQIRTGTMWINNFHAFGDFCPFGGYKQSGIGRELGEAGLKEYTELKRVHVAARADHNSNFMMKMFSDDPKINHMEYKTPTLVLAGHGSLFSISREVVRLGGTRALILTDAGVRDAGLTRRVRDALGDFCVGIFDDIEDTLLPTIDQATETAREKGADIIVSVGGGSVLDTAKAVCVTLKNGGKANDHVALMRLTEPQIPHIAIPTTAGTGSEVTNASVIKSTAAGRVLYLIDNKIIPDTAILDPSFTLALPPGLTATTAMDTIAHAVEALTNTMSNPLCDGHALQAIRLIRENLPRVMVNGKNEEARSNMQMAAAAGGWAWSNSMAGLAHSMAHTVGILCNVHHGAACGIVLPAVMRFNLDYAADKLALAAQALGVSLGKMDSADAALAGVDALENLMKESGHPMRLSELGVTQEALAMAPFHAIADTVTLFNARPVTDPNEIAELYNQVF